MKVTFITLGSRGDVQPFVALARALDAAGHEATVATQTPFEKLVTDQGVRFAPLGDRPEAIEDFETFSRMQYEAGRRAYKIITHANKWILDLLEDQLAGAEAACEGADLIVEGTMAMIAPHLAEYLDIPFARAYLRPETRTSAYRRPDLVYPESNFAIRRRGSYALSWIAVWSTVRSRVNQWRVAHGLRAWGRSNPTNFHHYRHRFPVLLGYSEHIAPREADYPPWHHITGFWPLDAAHGYQPPPALTGFLAAGSPPLTIGFGSIPVLDPSHMWQMIGEALDATRQRAVVLTGWGGLDRREGGERRHHLDTGDHVLALDAVPHDWLYPRSAAALHHGGAGASAASFRAGVPTMIVPFLWDQAFWGHRAHALGIGPLPIGQGALTTTWMIDAINASLTPSLQARAADVGVLLRSENGLGRAVELLEETAGAGRAACLR